MIYTLLLKARPLLKSRYWYIAVLIWLSLVSPAKALELRVAITEDTNQVKVGSSTQAQIQDGAGHTLGMMAPMNGFYARSTGHSITVAHQQASQIWIEPTVGGLVYIGNHWYRGRTKLVKTSQGLTVVNYINLEDYLASVVGREMYSNWPQEALKAQAVASRSYALHQRQQRGNSVFDVGDTTAWQVYEGIVGESASTRSAVAATTNQVLTYNGEIIEAVFHSSSGGHTENCENVWSSPLPYLRGVPDYDQTSPVYQWVMHFTAHDLSQRVSGVGNVIALLPLSLTPQGRVRQITVVGDRGQRTMSGSALRSALGLKSTLFTITPQLGLVATTGKPASRPVAFQVNGRGFGHGLGMSQWGALGQAQQGRTYDQMLQYYYQGTTLSQMQVQ